MDMDISMDIHEKSVDMDMDMDMDVIFHIHGNPVSPSLFNIYADMFINNVIESNSGCYLHRT